MGARMGTVGGPAEKPALLADANVLIDYRNTDLAILALVNDRVGPLAVVESVFQEVRRVSATDLEQLGIEIIETSEAQKDRAAAIDFAVSFNDRLAFVVCLDEGRICVTNDKDLQRLCEARGVQTRFGLRLLLDLVAVGAIDHTRAASVARKIQATNSRFINERVVERFLEELAELN